MHTPRNIPRSQSSYRNTSPSPNPKSASKQPNTSSPYMNTISSPYGRSTRREVEVMKNLDDTLGFMGVDLAHIKKNKEEARNKIEKQFEEVNRQLVTFKESFKVETKKLNEMISSITPKLVPMIEKVNNDAIKRHSQAVVDIDKKFIDMNSRLNHLDKAISKEREERTKHVEDSISPLITRIGKLEKALEYEKTVRLLAEKELSDRFIEETLKVNKRFEAEKTQNAAKFKELSSEIKVEFKNQQEYTESFRFKANEELQNTTMRLESVMDARFERQDKIANNLMNMLQNFRQTIRVLGDE